MATAKSTRMDAQGRVILPPHIRKEMNLNPGQLVNVSLEGGTIMIRPDEERCHLCGESVAENHHTKVTIGHEEKHICYRCAQCIARAMMK